MSGCCDEVWMDDAKLSSKQRKALSKGTFCAPNRGFPVNDCAHYTAALRMLSRYKGPGSKASIRACIMRKGKALGCTGAKNKDGSEYTDDEIEKIIASEEFDSSRELMAFLDYLHDNRTPDEDQADVVKESVCNLLDTMRKNRLGDNYESMKDAYMGRSMTSVLDALTDELNIPEPSKK